MFALEGAQVVIKWAKVIYPEAQVAGLMTHEEGGEAGKAGYMGGGIGAPGARCVGEHVVVRAMGGDGPLFVAADVFIHQLYTL